MLPVMGRTRDGRTAMWTEEHCRIYQRAGDGYPSDLRDRRASGLEAGGGSPLGPQFGLRARLVVPLWNRLA